MDGEVRKMHTYKILRKEKKLGLYTSSMTKQGGEVTTNKEK